MNRVYTVLRFRITKGFLLIAICLTGLLLVISNSRIYSKKYKNNIELKSDETEMEINNYIYRNHRQMVAEYFHKRRDWKTSTLGSILFKNLDVNNFNGRTNKTFNILIWKHFNAIKNRHFYYYGSKRLNPLEGCSVSNCIFTGDDNLLPKVDVVVVHLQRGIKPAKKYPGQLWIFLNDESAKHAFSMTKTPPRLAKLANKFNWSMSYRSDSEVPVPYGRTVALKRPIFQDISYLEITQIIPYWEKKQKNVLMTILLSHCNVPGRTQLLNEIKQYTQVEIFGKCSDNPKSKNICPGHFRADCEFMSYYLFYLVLENSKCKQYMTEKLFYNAYLKGAIPIIYGPSLKDCEALLPPNSFIHVDSFASVKDLVKEVISISGNEEKLLSYHLWRNDFEVLNEHGYFGTKSYHMCRLCEALNYNDFNETLYNEDRIREFLDPTRSCK